MTAPICFNLHVYDNRYCPCSVAVLEAQGTYPCKPAPVSRYNGISALADFLRECVGLKTLILRRNHLHTEAVKFVADGLCRNKTLTHLDLSGRSLFRAANPVLLLPCVA